MPKKPLAHSPRRHRCKRKACAGGALPSTKSLRAGFIPWLDEIDGLVGREARVDLSRGYSFMSAWREGMSPSAAVREAIDWLAAR
jgi:hypothetical protein